MEASGGNWQVMPEDPDQLAPSATLPRLITASELYTGQVVRLRPLLEGLIWDGLTMIVAKPKAGKSYFMLQAAVQVAGGPAIDGVTALDHGPVLYGAFEEPAARTMARLRQVAPAGEWADSLHFVYDLLPLMGGGAEQLGALVEQLKPRMVVLDTLTALIKGGGKRGKRRVPQSVCRGVGCPQDRGSEPH